MNETATWFAIGCLGLWGAALTVFVMRSSCPNPQVKTDKGGPSGPVMIREFFKDKFGNIVKREKRAPRRGDDTAAFLAEQKENDK